MEEHPARGVEKCVGLRGLEYRVPTNYMGIWRSWSGSGWSGSGKGVWRSTEGANSYLAGLAGYPAEDGSATTADGEGGFTALKSTYSSQKACGLPS